MAAGGDGLDDIEMMKAGEMKAELDMRGVSYVGCYDKTDLKELLHKSRAEGKADPAVIDEVSPLRMRTSSTVKFYIAAPPSSGWHSNEAAAWRRTS